ncbi:MAG: Unknown protein [uncultured Thiotrichaceae bacterium]|uniref:Cytoskeleton protein RodZ-like C-terminal domain-containing protein n=1 Tax=uncultured Thiotrichaceae bacterium TaxID=298394 RepID=A0A6S6U6X1_9GAMM|nr:MAG: Unknown protein [uncultured Thiotrichaceae bacterium]
MSKDTGSDNTVENEAINTGSLGSLLQEYREQANLDIQSVAQALRLPVSAVEALENENFSELPEPPYVRGYLRSYARLADADPQQAITLYETIRGSDSNRQTRIPTAIENAHYSPKNPPQELISPFRFKMGLLSLGILGLIIFSMIPSVQEKAGNIWSSFSPDKEIQDVETTINTTISDNVAGNLPVSAPAPVEEPTDNTESQATDIATNTTTDSGNGTFNTTISDNATSESSTEEAVEQSPDTEPETTTSSTQNTVEDSSSVASSATTETPVENSDPTVEEANGATKLKLVFSDEVWIRINDGEGKRLFEALNPAGTEKELLFNKPLKFKIGNAQGMKLFVDGEETDISKYINGSIAKFGLE